MPFKDPEKAREYQRERARRRREDPAFLEYEAKRKAKWALENKAKKRDALRDYRTRVREQNILNMMKEIGDE